MKENMLENEENFKFKQKIEQNKMLYMNVQIFKPRNSSLGNKKKHSNNFLKILNAKKSSTNNVYEVFLQSTTAF